MTHEEEHTDRVTRLDIEAAEAADRERRTPSAGWAHRLPASAGARPSDEGVLSEALPTERIRDMYSWATAWCAETPPDRLDMVALRDASRDEFDLWLAAHDEEIRAAANALAPMAERRT